MWGSAPGGYSQDGVIPEDTDGFRALLSGDKAELHGDGFVQVVLQQFVVVVHGDADHRRVDDRTLWHTDDSESAQKLKNLQQFPQMLSVISASSPQAPLVGVVALR